jgi:hypothetical protein
MEEIQELLFDHKQEIPEGLYVKLMDLLKKQYNLKEKDKFEDLWAILCAYSDGALTATGELPTPEDVCDFLEKFEVDFSIQLIKNVFDKFYKYDCLCYNIEERNYNITDYPNFDIETDSDYELEEQEYTDDEYISPFYEANMVYPKCCCCEKISTDFVPKTDKWYCSYHRREWVLSIRPERDLEGILFRDIFDRDIANINYYGLFYI